MVILDLSIVNVALPSIQSSLGFSSPDLQWVVDAYAITFAGFLMLGGRAADHFGQRRMFVARAAAVRARLAGRRRRARPGGADRRARAAGPRRRADGGVARWRSSPPRSRPARSSTARSRIWAAMNGLGGAAGVLFGGIITEVLSWRWVLLINPPIAIARRARRLRGRQRAPQRPTRGLRPRGRADADDRSDGARLRRRRSGPRGLGHVRRARPDHRRPRPARLLRRDRVARRLRAADPVQGADQAAARRQHDRRCCSAPRCSRCGS